MFKKCEICGKEICDDYGAFKRIDEKVKNGDGKISNIKKKYYHNSCYDNFEKKRNELMEVLKNGGKSSKM